MPLGKRIHTCLEALYAQRKLARDVFLGVVLLCGLAALWTQQYSASAIVALTQPSPHSHAVEQVRDALTDERLGAIIERLHLYQEMVWNKGEAAAVSYVRSRISLEATGPDLAMVRIVYHSQDKATVAPVTNALARSVAELKASSADLLPTDIGAQIKQQMEDSRSELKVFAAGQHTQPQRALQASILRDEKLQAGLREDANKLTFLDERAEEEGIGNRARIRRQEESIRAAQTRLEKEVQRNNAAIERLSKKFAKSSGDARAYALELDRYHALQRAQKTMQDLGGVDQPVLPLFRVVQGASRVKYTGAVLSPLFWIASLLAALFAAAISVMLAPRREAPMRMPVRSDFETEELAPHYRHGTR
jgi:hypothetical protein